MKPTLYDLGREIEIVEALYEQEFKAGRTSSCNMLLQTAGRLKKQYYEISVRTGELLGRGALTELGAALAKILLEELRFLPDDQFAEIPLRIMDRTQALMSSPPNNTKEDIQKLLGRQR